MFQSRSAHALAWHDFAVAELDEGERNGVEKEHRAYDAADGLLKLLILAVGAAAIARQLLP